MYKFTPEQQFFADASESKILKSFIVAKLDYKDQGSSWSFGNFYNYLSYMIRDVLLDTKLFNEKKKPFCISDPFMRTMIVENRHNVFAEFFVDCLESAISYCQNSKQKMKVFSVDYGVYKNINNVIKIFSKYLNLSEGFYNDAIIDSIKDKNILISALKKNPELFGMMVNFICNLK